MKHLFRTAIMALAGLALIVSGCTPAGKAANATPPLAQSQPIILQNPPTQTGLKESAPQPADPALASADGLVWNDLNRNGLQDLDEPGLHKVTVNLMTTARTLAATTTTGPKGDYRFQDVPPADYFVSLVPPADYVYSPQDQGENELVDSDTDPVLTETAPVTLLAGENGLVWTTGIYDPAAPARPQPGTVRPPLPSIDVCSAGVYSLGGLSTLRVNQLAADYCLHAFLWNHAFAVGRIPDGAGSVLAPITFVEVFYQGVLVYQYDVPGETQSILVCYAVPVGRQAQIYFLDFYGSRFGQRTGQPSWVPLETTIQDGVACAVAQTSGAYALIGK